MELDMETVYARSTDMLIKEAEEASGHRIEIAYWNLEYHVMIDGRHRFAAQGYECRCYLQGLIEMCDLNKAR